MNTLLMVDGTVGESILNWMLDNHLEDVSLVVVVSENELQEAAVSKGVPCLVFESSQQCAQYIGERALSIDYGFLIWWPLIIKEPLISLPKQGFVNTHPSFLPHNRGKHYNFWALVEQCPFGVSLHKVEPTIDSGEIVSQVAIPYDWEDTGGTLYQKAQVEMEALFKSTYSGLRSGQGHRQVQDLSRGSYHNASELEQASRIDLDKSYTAREFLNLLRARTFEGMPGCWFEDGEHCYEVRIDISRRKQ